MNIKTKLNELIAASGNCVNLGRTLQAFHKEIYQKVLDNTRFLTECKFNERVYCIINDINSVVFDEFDKPARFINLFRGYSMLEHDKQDQIKLEEKQKLAQEKKKLDAEKEKLNTPIARLIRRHERNTPELYADTAILGVDYVECPLTKARFHLLTSKYVENVLKMTMEEYDAMFPGIKKISDVRMNNVKAGLHKVDEVTGKTPHQIAMEKAGQKLRQVGADGLSGYNRKGRKTRETHMNNIDEFGRNGYSQLAVKAIINGNATKAAKGLITSHENRKTFHRYKSLVTYLTNMHRKTLTKDYKIGLAGVDGAWHLDHNYSIMHGFMNKVSPCIIGSIHNLSMLPWEDNTSKHHKSSIDLNSLLQLNNYTSEQSISEFEFVMNEITTQANNGTHACGAIILERLYESELYKQYRL